MANIKALTKSVEPGNYDARVRDFHAIRDANNGLLFECMSDAFLFGFLKGQRSEKARIEREKEVLS